MRGGGVLWRTDTEALLNQTITDQMCEMCQLTKGEWHKGQTGKDGGILYFSIIYTSLLSLIIIIIIIRYNPI